MNPRQTNNKSTVPRFRAFFLARRREAVRQSLEIATSLFISSAAEGSAVVFRRSVAFRQSSGDLAPVRKCARRHGRLSGVFESPGGRLPMSVVRMGPTLVIGLSSGEPKMPGTTGRTYNYRQHATRL